MAKFFITNSKSIEENIHRHILTTDFTVSSRFHVGNCYSVAVQKRKAKHINAVSKKHEFCVITGSCIYKESLNYGQLLDDFSGDIVAIRDNALGQYAACIYKDNCIYIFSDACGCHDVYYYHDKDSYLISDSLYEMAIVLKDKLELDSEKVLERAVNRAILNGETFLKQIRRLRGCEYIEITDDISKLFVHRLSTAYPINEDKQRDDVIDKVVTALRKNASISAKVLGTPIICMTGGLDSRLLLAAYLSAGVKPKLLYGVGNSSITSPRNEDEQCVDALSAKFGLEKIRGDFSISKPVNKDWDYLIHNYGFNAAYMWGSSMNIIESLSGPNVENGFLLFGWGGELYRNIDHWTELAEKNRTNIHELVEKWYLNRQTYNDVIKDLLPKYGDQITEHLSQECEYIGVDPNDMCIDDSYLIELAYRCQADTQIPSFLQQSGYVYLLLFEDEILHYRMSHSEKDNARFMLEVIYRLCPDVMDCPLFSHGCYQSFDASTMTMNRISPNVFEKIYRSHIFKVITYPIPEALILWVRGCMVKLLAKRRAKKDRVKQVAWIEEIRRLKQPLYAIDITSSRNGEDIAQYAILLQALLKIGY